MRESHRSHMAAPTSACSGLACSPQSDTVRWAQYHTARSFQLQRASLEKHSVVQLLQAQELKNLPAKTAKLTAEPKLRNLNFKSNCRVPIGTFTYKRIECTNAPMTSQAEKAIGTNHNNHHSGTIITLTPTTIECCSSPIDMTRATKRLYSIPPHPLY